MTTEAGQAGLALLALMPERSQNCLIELDKCVRYQMRSEGGVSRRHELEVGERCCGEDYPLSSACLKPRC